jgi:glycine dehydrogenase
MVEPTESESVQEIDRFVEAMIAIKNECEEIKNGTADAEDNVLKMAPHTAEEVCGNEWNHKYDRMKAAYPLEWIKENKFWPACTRVDNGYGDRNLVCTCASIESYL